MEQDQVRGVPTAGRLEQAQAVRRRTERLARVLDSAIGIPGTRIRIGLDALIGMLPGVGDVIGIVLGAWFLLEGVRAGAPPALLGRMAGNLAVDALSGLVPVLGDVLDVAFKANLRNARLLGEHLDRVEGRLPPPSRRWTAYALAVVIVIVTGLAVYGAWNLIAGVF